jgi:sRNA-binding carbon storage regulator CsrA
MEDRKLHMMEVEGKEIRLPIDAPKRVIDPMTMVEELKQIVNQKNSVIERQTDYIMELQEENSKLRQMVKLLNI